MLKNSTNSFIKSLNGSSSTIFSNLKTNLEELTKLLEATTPHFVHCLIPNTLRKSHLFEPSIILRQLTNFQIMDVIKISRKTFSDTIAVDKFVQRYWMLADRNEFKQEQDYNGRAKAILKKHEEKQYKVGDKYVYLKSGEKLLLEELRAKKIYKIIVRVQSLIRSAIVRNKMQKKTEQQEEKPKTEMLQRDTQIEQLKMQNQELYEKLKAKEFVVYCYLY